MKKKSKKCIVEDKNTNNEMKLLADFAMGLDKKNQVLKKLLEQKSSQKDKKL